MSRTDNNNGPLSIDTPIDEDRVRRALGLKTGGQQQTHQQRPEQARQRHKFISDGAVPVVMLNRSDSETVSLRERLVTLEAALENERSAHAGTRRALHDLQLVHQTLQTQARHHDMTQTDMLVAERDGRRVAEAALASIRSEVAVAPVPRKAARVVEDLAVEDVEVDDVGVEDFAVEEAEVERVAVAPSAAEPVRRGRKPRVTVAPAKEPKPVRWWTPSYRAKK